MNLRAEIARKIVRSESFLKKMEEVILSELESSENIVVVSGEHRRSIAERNKKLKESFNGSNLKELAKQFFLTPRQVRNIVVPKRAKGLK